MKKSAEIIMHRVLPVLLMLTFFSLGCLAQDLKLDKSGNDIWNWITSHWKWIVGIILLLIVISAIGGSRGRRTTIVEDDGTGRITRTTTTTEY
jgi:hypothetical protein